MVKLKSGFTIPTVCGMSVKGKRTFGLMSHLKLREQGVPSDSRCLEFKASSWFCRGLRRANQESSSSGPG